MSDEKIPFLTLLLLAVLAMTVGCSCSGETEEERRARLQREYDTWAATLEKPSLTLDVPGIMDVFNIPIVATSDGDAEVRVYLDDELVRESRGSIATSLFLNEGVHEIEATARWCFAPPSHLTQFGESCPSTASKTEVIVDTSPPLWRNIETEPEGELLVVRGEVEDVSRSFVSVGDFSVEVDDYGEFELKTPYEDLPDPAKARLLFIDELGHLSCATIDIPPPLTFWGKYDGDGKLQQIVTDPDFKPPEPILGYGKDEWRQYEEGVLVEKRHTPLDFYIRLGIIGAILFLGVIGAFVYHVTLPGRKLTEALQTTIERALPAPAAQAETPALPPAAQGLLSEFAAQHQDAARELETFLEGKKERLIEEGKECKPSA